MTQSVLKIHAGDNAILALRDIAAGSDISFDGATYTLSEDIPAKHKFAATALRVGDAVTMYGLTVGRATMPIACGARMTTQNVAHDTGDGTDNDGPPVWTPPTYAKLQGRTFQGFVREDGRVGTANYWLIVPLVFCENRNVMVLREALLKELGYDRDHAARAFARQLADAARAGASAEELTAAEMSSQAGDPVARAFPQVDGIKFLMHSLGCGGTYQDAEALCGLLAGYICHPNVAGATVLSLGCQNAQIENLQKEIDRRGGAPGKPVYCLEQQKLGTEQALMQEALRSTFAGLTVANRAVRTAAGIEHLVLGVECGGSDGFSGVSANPVIGHTSDLLVAGSGTVILSEFPELCGCEKNLASRCESPELASRFIHLMQTYQTRAQAVGSGFDSNPSAGNIRDGLITDAMKSAGAARKGGGSPVADVLDYPQRVTRRGLNLLCTPGNDVESTTAMVGAGANVLVFSTGLGTPTGNPIAPVLKLSTNSVLASRMPDIIDLDAGRIIEGRATIPALGEELFELVIATASGDYQAKAVGLGQDDFQPWKRGVSL